MRAALMSLSVSVLASIATMTASLAQDSTVQARPMDEHKVGTVDLKVVVAVSFDPSPFSGKSEIVFHMVNDNADAWICAAPPTITQLARFKVDSIVPDPPKRLSEGRLCLDAREARDWRVYLHEKSTFAPWQRLFGFHTEDESAPFSISYNLFDETQNTAFIRGSRLEDKVLLTRGSPGSPIFGLIVGVALLLLLLLSSDRMNWAGVPKAFLQGVVGGIAVVALGNVSTGFRLPIAFEVKDFLGGLVLGLISRRFVAPLVEFLVERVRGPAPD